MTIQFIPISAVPAQTFTIQLNSQNCMINIYQKNTGLFFDLNLNGTQIVNSMICLNLVGLVRESYLGFTGQLFFFDTSGQTDPVYTGLNSKYLLVYQV